MKRLLAVLLLTMGPAACVSQADFDAHMAEYQAIQTSYNTLLGQLTTWGDGMYAWGMETGDVICDVARANGPMTKYTPATQDYCGPGDPGNDPPEPPEWGG